MKYKYLITEGLEKPLETVQFHNKAPLTRYELLQRDELNGDGGMRIVTHIISELPEKIESYCDLHWHEFDEINIILSEDKSLKYRITLEDEIYEAGSPTTIYT